jgi:hypothetical protein
MKRLSASSIVFVVAVSLLAISGGYWLHEALASVGRPALPAPPPAIVGPPALKPPEPPQSPPAVSDSHGAAVNDAFTVTADGTGIAWAPTDSAQIHPGSQAYTGDSQCTTNFVFTDDNKNVYIGLAAHCASTGAEKDTNGCTSASRPLGTTVTFHRGGPPGPRDDTVGSGELVYSSWISMRYNQERDADVCAYNDFALVRIKPEDAAKVNPTVPYWGGPIGINTNGTNQGDTVHSYGNSRLRFGAAPLSPQTGTANAANPAADGWSHSLTSPTPGIPGDSGSAYIDSTGNALGTLSTFGLTIPIINNIGDLAHELAYAQTHSGIGGIKLVLGTTPFNPNP